MRYIRGVLLMILWSMFPFHEVVASYECRQQNIAIGNQREVKLQDQISRSYAQIKHLVENIENGTFDEISSIKQYEAISNFISILAYRGRQNNRTLSELEKDKLTLIGHNPLGRSCYQPGKYSTVGFRSNFNNLKSFCKKYKKEILIGAVIVVVASVVVVMAVSVSSAAAASVAGGAAGATDSFSSKERTKTEDEKSGSNFDEVMTSSIHEVEPDIESENIDLSSDLSAKPEASEAYSSPFDIDRFLPNYNELSKYGWIGPDVENSTDSTNNINELTIYQKFENVMKDIKNFESFLQHELLEELIAFPRFGVEIVEEIREQVLDKYVDNPELLAIDPDVSALQIFDEFVLKLHEAIDFAYESDYADRYTAEARSIQPEQTIQIGMVPFPGLGANQIISNKYLLRSATRHDRGGFTKIGRSIMKKSYRDNSMYRKVTGTPADINAHGTEILRKILDNPNREISLKRTVWNGEVRDVISPPYGAARFTLDGEFITLLEL